MKKYTSKKLTIKKSKFAFKSLINRLEFSKKLYMKTKKIIISLLSSLTLLTFQKPINSNEIYDCEYSTLKVYQEDFVCNDLNSYFLNSFYSNHHDSLLIEQLDTKGEDFYKRSSFYPVVEWLGLYLKNVSGNNKVVFGFPDQRMKKDSLSLWEAFNYELNNTIEKPRITGDLNNGYNSSILSDAP